MSTSLQALIRMFTQAERALFYHEINLGVNSPIFQALWRDLALAALQNAAATIASI